jgi:GT2 family glycosyltransferase
MPLPLVVVPVFNAFEYLRRCLDALAQASPGAEVLVIDDASTDPRVRPLLCRWVDAAPTRHLLLQAENRGFVHSANEGMRQAAGDVVLLNSDTEVTPGWLEALGRCLLSDRRIATATPWTNNGEIASLPEFCRKNPPPPEPGALARALDAGGAAVYPEIPTAVGFCMAVARSAIRRIGLFDEAAFGQGYGEENDFSMRARAAGLRNVLCDDAYVVHHGGASFGPLGLAPDGNSMRRLLAKHPGYHELVAEFIRADPLAGRRQAVLEALRRAGVRMS